MSRYTVKGSAELDERIDADLARIAETASTHSAAGVLLGSYGRGEGTPFIRPDGSQAPFNDYDLVVVVNRLNPEIRKKFQELARRISAELDFPVSLYPYRKNALPRSKCSLLNYEMKHGHHVLWGDPDILGTMPDYPPSTIPLTEGSRLLLNRGKLLLDIQLRLALPEALNEEEQIRFVKFLLKVKLALGDCALLAGGQYDSYYAEKKSRIRNLNPFPNQDLIISCYLKAIEMKEWGDVRNMENFNVAAEFEHVRAVFLRFMPWYRARSSQKEGSAFKNLAANLKWNGRLSTAHPREELYDAIINLLQGSPGMNPEDFYRLQRRFS
jgi:hypothetical protein